jgi:hypothetical protein
MMSKSHNNTPKDVAGNFTEHLKQYLKKPAGKVLAGIAIAAAGIGVYEAGSSITVRNDKAGHEIAVINSKNFYRYKMLENVDSLKSHGACSAELQAESTYYSKAAKIVGPEGGIYEPNLPQNYKYLSDNAKIYAKSAKLADANEVSCFPANSKLSNLTPHFDVNNMTNTRQCTDVIAKTPIENVTGKPTQLAQDLAAANNARREIAIQFAKTQNIPC